MVKFFKRYFAGMKKSFKAHPVVYVFIRVMWITVIGVMIRSLINGNLENAGICVISLLLFLLPPFVEDRFKVEIPLPFQVVIWCFIFASEILGEIANFYTRFPGWDTILHTLNGFNCAAVGFSFAHILNDSDNAKIKMSPFFIALVGFCFSMTVGVVWEFVEFGFDFFLHRDMQKDFIVSIIGTVTLDSTNTQTPVIISDIVKTTIETASGETYVVNGGYLDIGIMDTMKDLLVNFVGAIVFCFIGYFFEKSGTKKGLLKNFLITRKKSAEKEKETSDEAKPEIEIVDETNKTESPSDQSSES